MQQIGEGALEPADLADIPKAVTCFSKLAPQFESLGTSSQPDSPKPEINILSQQVADAQEAVIDALRGPRDPGDSFSVPPNLQRRVWENYQQWQACIAEKFTRNAMNADSSRRVLFDKYYRQIVGILFDGDSVNCSETVGSFSILSNLGKLAQELPQKTLLRAVNTYVASSASFVQAQSSYRGMASRGAAKTKGVDESRIPIIEAFALPLPSVMSANRNGLVTIMPVEQVAAGAGCKIALSTPGPAKYQMNATDMPGKTKLSKNHQGQPASTFSFSTTKIDRVFVNPVQFINGQPNPMAAKNFSFNLPPGIYDIVMVLNHLPNPGVAYVFEDCAGSNELDSIALNTQPSDYFSLRVF
ncbi:MAG: hypothetical protein WA020_09450 [Candidatus Acidiferrales bacterium]